MKKHIEETKLDLWIKILKKSLIANGVKYQPGASRYVFTVGKNECSLTVKNGKILIENHTAKKVDCYDFNSKTPDSVYTHCRLTANDLDEVNITYSDLLMPREDMMLISSAAAIIDTDVTQERCANKVLFFVDSLIGDTIHDTLENLSKFDGSVPKAITQDVPRRTNIHYALENTIRNERRLISAMNEIKTR